MNVDEQPVKDKVMATYTDASGIHTYSPTNSDVIVLADLQAVQAYYNQFVAVSYSPPAQRQRITTVEWTNLKNAISAAFAAQVATSGITYDMSKLPVFNAGKILSTSWPAPSAMFSSMEKEYTTPGNTVVTIPSGCNSILVEWIVGGGGGGGSGTESQNGGGGGGGGSGGYYTNRTFAVTAGESLTISIGGGGGYGGAGGASAIYLNSTLLLEATGGGGGGNGSDWTGGDGGAGGSPAGGTGVSGSSGWDQYAWGWGGNGADGPFGGGGVRGYGGNYGSDATAYGAGGGGSGFSDRTWPYVWHGSNGAGGYAKISYRAATA